MWYPGLLHGGHLNLCSAESRLTLCYVPATIRWNAASGGVCVTGCDERPILKVRWVDAERICCDALPACDAVVACLPAPSPLRPAASPAKLPPALSILVRYLHSISLTLKWAVSYYFLFLCFTRDYNATKQSAFSGVAFCRPPNAGCSPKWRKKACLKALLFVLSVVFMMS